MAIERALFFAFVLPLLCEASFFGIPVPGNSITPIDVLQLYVRSCRIDENGAPQADLLSTAVELLANSQAEGLVEQLYSELFYAVHQVDVGKLTGKWIRIFNSADVDNSECAIMQVKMVHSTPSTAYLSVKEHYQDGGMNGKIALGYVNKLGPDPGGILFSTGRQEDTCPYFIVNVGPSNGDQYDFLVLSNFFKQPVVVYARELDLFNSKYSDGVKFQSNCSTPFDD